MADNSFVKIISGWMETSAGPNLCWIDTSSRFALDKIARASGTSTKFIPPELQKKIAEIQGKLPKDKIAFYNRALGTQESYGINKNGDCWFRRDLLSKHGTFVSDAEYYKNHDNKRGISPAFGRPIASSFNDRTDMVDLIILADFDKQAQEDLQRIERGESLPTSMGCRVAYDICLLCDNKAKHRGEYCEHVKEGAAYPFGMGNVLPDGRICGVSNPNPTFFDISRLPGGNPAFVGSENLLKVAAAIASSVPNESSAAKAERIGAMPKVKSEKSVTPAAKTASRGQKLADMIKNLPGRIDSAMTLNSEKLDEMGLGAAAVCEAAPKIPKGKLKELAKKAGVDRVFSTATAMGLIFSPEEFTDLTGVPAASPKPEDILSQEASKTAIELVVGVPDTMVAKELQEYAQGRSFLQPFLVNALANASTWTGNSGSVKQASAVSDNTMYNIYRSAVLASLSSTSKEGERLAMKLAETITRKITPSSASFALLAFCQDDMGQEKKAVSTVQILAKDQTVEDTRPGSMPVSGNMADEFGEDVLETLAFTSLQKLHRS